MTVLRSLVRRSIENPLRPLTDAALIDVLGDGSKVHAGVSVNEKSAMGVSAVWRAVNLLSGTGASLPLKPYQSGTRKALEAQILDEPHPDMTPFEYWEWVYVSLLLWGNAYSQKIRNGAGRVVELWPLMPGSVNVGRVKPFEGNPSGKMFEVTDAAGHRHALTSDEVFHIPGMGYDGVTGASPIRIARQSIGLALAAEEYGARLFGSGSLMAGILQTEQRLKDDQAEALKRRWTERITGLARAHEVAVLDNGAKFQPIGIPPEDAQFIEGRRFQIAEVARWFGVPPHMLMDTERSTSWGTGIEQQSIGFVVYTLRSSWLTRIEQRVTKELLPTGQYAKYSIEGLLRGDSAARAAFYKVMWEIGVYNRDEIRDLEEREPLPDGLGQDYMQPMNFEVVGEEPADPGQRPDIEEDLGEASARIAALEARQPLVIQPQVHVAPAAGAKSRKVERDEAGNIMRIVEESA